MGPNDASAGGRTGRECQRGLDARVAFDSFNAGGRLSNSPAFPATKCVLMAIPPLQSAGKSRGLDSNHFLVRGEPRPMTPSMAPPITQSDAHRSRPGYDSSNLRLKTCRLGCSRQPTMVPMAFIAPSHARPTGSSTHKAPQSLRAKSHGLPLRRPQQSKNVTQLRYPDVWCSAGSDRITSALTPLIH